MDSRKIVSNPNPRETANCFSALTWAWITSLFRKGYSKNLGVEDLYDPINPDRSHILGDRFEKQWFAELDRAKKKNCPPSLIRSVVRTLSYELFLLGCYAIFTEIIMRFSLAYLLGAFLQYFQLGSETTFEAALLLASANVIGCLITVTLHPHRFFFAVHTSAQLRIGIGSVLYRKALRLSNTALSETAPGKIVNLVANDVNRFNLIFFFLIHISMGPLVSLIIFGILYSEIGWSALVGITLMFLSIPFQSYLGKLSSKFRLQTSIKTDERVRLMDEIISGVQVIKMYAWEKPFCALIELTRRLELKVVRNSSCIKGIFVALYNFTARMALFGTLITMMLRGQELIADRVFVYVSFFNLMALQMAYGFVRGISEIAECVVAIKRLQDFLMYDEFQWENSSNDKVKSDNIGISDSIKELEQKSVVQQVEIVQAHNAEEEKLSMDDYSIKLKHATAKWNLKSPETTLKDIDLEVPKGKLYIVIGTVGAGKSSLIASILGELKLSEGSKTVNGRMSYADQNPWVFASSVRQNIIFGQEFDKQRYQKVVKVCALQKDFEQFPRGDQTIVGEKGSSLSGGQKARINLARAVYRQADIYLLDDPLSAVDAHVSKQLFEDCIQRYLADKTRILATHQLQYIKGADAIVLLDRGKIHVFSDIHELLRAYPEYNTLMAEEKATNSTNQNRDSYISRRMSSASTKSKASEVTEAELSGEDNDDDFYESTSRGVVKRNLLIKYVSSGVNIIFALIVPFLFVASQFCISLNDWFIPMLVNVEERRHYLNGSNIETQENMLSRETYMYIYTGIIVSILLMGLARSWAFYGVCLRCSQSLHDNMFSALIRAPMRFFNTNPSGRILNRFSKDLASIDELLPLALLEAGQFLMIISGSLILTCLVNILFIIPMVLIGVVFYFITIVYLRTSKNLKRIEGITRAPIYTHLNATLNGITTIRAYDAQSILEIDFDRLQNTNMSASYMYNASNVAFGFFLDFFCFIFLGLVTFTCLMLRDNVSAGVVGMVITQLNTITGWFQWGIRQSAEAANELTAVERILEYSQLAPESNLRDAGASAKKKKKKSGKGRQDETELMLGVNLIEPPNGWPTRGRIEFKNVYLRYSDDDPPVLKDLTLTIQPGEKVGIVGRTGAGKSSLISALFRLAKVEGIIDIDDIDTGTIALEDLRKQISIIPQDPVLFSGTLRHNLDPFKEFPDEHLWEVLEEVELKEPVQSTGDGMDYRVQDGGSNYSTGQRQLICLARAILRNNKVLMLDEATANVDPQTDALIQRTIRTKFAQCTVLTVAHRLNTIMDSDKVIVMDKGVVIECNHPHVLFQNENGPFSLLVKESGSAMYEQLKKVAWDMYTEKYGTGLP